MSDFKAKMHQDRFRLGLCRRSRWGSLQCSPKPAGWNNGDLRLREREGCRERKEKGGKREVGKRGEGKEREGIEEKGKEGRGEWGDRETRHTNPSLLPAPL